MVSGVTDVATIESSRCLNLLNDFCYKKLLEFFADARHFTLASRCARPRHGYVTNLIKRRGRRGFRRGTQRAELCVSDRALGVRILQRLHVQSDDGGVLRGSSPTVREGVDADRRVFDKARIGIPCVSFQFYYGQPALFQCRTISFMLCERAAVIRLSEPYS